MFYVSKYEDERVMGNNSDEEKGATEEVVDEKVLNDEIIPKGWERGSSECGKKLRY